MSGDLILIKADTSAVMLEELDDLQIGKLCIERAKRRSELISDDSQIYVLVRLIGWSNGYSMFYYDKGDIRNVTEEEFRDVLNRNNIETAVDLANIQNVEVDLYR
jgi:hypothetical protein